MGKSEVISKAVSWLWLNIWWLKKESIGDEKMRIKNIVSIIDAKNQVNRLTGSTPEQWWIRSEVSYFPENSMDTLCIYIKVLNRNSLESYWIIKRLVYLFTIQGVGKKNLTESEYFHVMRQT